MRIRWPWLRHDTPPAEPAQGVEEAEAARREAEHRRVATLEVLKLRDDVRRRNHIADDIGKAYRIIHGRG